MKFYKYTPALLDPKSLEETLIGRDVELNNLKRILKSASTGQSLSHSILIGAKGIGKTHLLRILYHAINGDIKTKGLNNYKNNFIPVIFSEEEYPGNLTKFILLALKYLIESKIEKIPPIPEELINPSTLGDRQYELAFSYLKTFKKKTGKVLLLLVDNLNDIIERFTTEDQSSFREILMTCDGILLVGSAPTLFDSILNHDKPLYNFFEIIWLKELPFEETIALLQRYAKLEDRNDLIKKFKESEPKLRAIHELAGGNPRLILSLYHIIVEDDITSIETVFLKLLDELSPYFRERMKDITGQQSEIIDVIARAEKLLTPTEIAARCQMHVNIVNSQLKRLEKTGYVRKSTKKRVKRVLYDLNEKLFSLWRQMRVEAGRKRLGFIVRFLEIWFAKEELIDLLEKTLDEINGCIDKGDFDKLEVSLNKSWYLSEAVPGVKNNILDIISSLERIKKSFNKFCKIFNTKFKLKPNEQKIFTEFAWCTIVTWDLLLAGNTKKAKKTFNKVFPLLLKTTNRTNFYSFFPLVFQMAVEGKEIQVIKFFLQELHAKKQQELLELLSPYSTLLNYLENKDREIIERLRHEERIVVEEMLKMLEGKPAEKNKKGVRKKVKGEMV